MEGIATPEAVLSLLKTAAGLGSVLVVTATGATPGQLFQAAAGWAAAGTLAGVPVGLLLAHGLRRRPPGPAWPCR